MLILELAGSTSRSRRSGDIGQCNPEHTQSTRDVLLAPDNATKTNATSASRPSSHSFHHGKLPWNKPNTEPNPLIPKHLNMTITSP